MSYTPTVYVDGQAPAIDAANLNHNENGLQAAAAAADAAQTTASAALPTPAGTNGQFLKRVGGVWVPTTFLASDIPSYPTDGTQVLKGDGSWSKPPGYEYSYVPVTTNQTTTVTSAATAVAVATAAAVTFDGSTAARIEFFCPEVFHSVAGTAVVFELYDGSTDIGILARVFSSLTNQGPHAHLVRELTPSAAAHTYSVRAWGGGAGTSNANAGAGGTSTDVPMFIRVTKA